MKEVAVTKIILLSLIAVIMACNGANWFYQWNLNHEIDPFLVVRVTTLDMAKVFIRFLAWFVALLVLPLFAEQFVSGFALKKLKFKHVFLGIESVLCIYAFGLSDDLFSGFVLFSVSQLLALVNTIAISRVITNSVKAEYHRSEHV